MNFLKFLFLDIKGILVLVVILYGLLFGYWIFYSSQKVNDDNYISTLINSIPMYPNTVVNSLTAQQVELNDLKTIASPYTEFEKYSLQMSTFINSDYRKMLEFYDDYFTSIGLEFVESTISPNPTRWQHSDDLTFSKTKGGAIWRFRDPNKKSYLICLRPYSTEIKPYVTKDGVVKKNEFGKGIRISITRNSEQICH